jgi:hypothetical protein
MSHFQQQKEFYNQPVRLSAQQKANPYLVFDKFFGDYHLWEIRDWFSQIGEVCLTVEDHPFCEPNIRANLLLLHKNIELLFEAAFVINAQNPIAAEG